MAQAKVTYINWCPDGAGTKIVAPPVAQSNAGFTANQPVPYQWLNYLLYTLDQSIQTLDAQAALQAPNSTSGMNARLINGGTFAFNATTGAVSWSQAANIAFPGVADSNNTIAAGSFTLADGAVLSVAANVPFTTTGNAASGSTQLTNLAYQLGITAGMSVTGTGIAAGTTVVSLIGTTVTLSQSATASTTGAVYTFESSGALTPSVSANTDLISAVNTVVIARRVGSIVIIGIGSGQMILRDGERRQLLDAGFLYTFSAPAGQVLTANAPVYLSPGSSDGGRTAGALYPCDASVANGAVRAAVVGVTASAAASGATALVAVEGVITTSGLTPGAVYYINPASPGSLTATKPATTGQYVVGIGVALSTTQLAINPIAAIDALQVGSVFSVDNYGVSNETQLATALAAAASGGIIALLAPFTLSASYAVPSGVIIEGSLNATLLTVTSASAGLTLSTAARLRDVSMTTSVAATLVSVTGNNCLLNGCRFSVSSSTSARCVDIFGNAARVYDCTFSGVAASTTAVGIYYEKGPTDNADFSSVFQP